MKNHLVFRIALNFTVALALLLGMNNLSLVAAQSSLADIKEGYAGGSLAMPAGDLTIGDTKIWTESGLVSSFVVYKEDPNRFELPWQQLTITLRDDTKIRASGIETNSNKRNFILVVHKEKILYVPFAAISTLVLTEEPKKTLSGLRIDEEVYGRFRFERNPYPPLEFTFLATVNLRFPLKNDQSSVKGWLLDYLGNVGYYIDSKWETIPWKSVKKLDISYPLGKDGGSKQTTLLPSFVYRMQGDHSNVWKEYSFPKKEK